MAKARRPVRSPPAGAMHATPVAAAAGATPALNRVSKGTRPQFYETEAIDQLLAIATALAAEMSVAFDRIDTLERVLTAAGMVSAEAIESYLPDATGAQERAVKREELIQRIFAVFETRSG